MTPPRYVGFVVPPEHPPKKYRAARPLAMAHAIPGHKPATSVERMTAGKKVRNGNPGGKELSSIIRVVRASRNAPMQNVYLKVELLRTLDRISTSRSISISWRRTPVRNM
jgi:hypothetical protein